MIRTLELESEPVTKLLRRTLIVSCFCASVLTKPRRRDGGLCDGRRSGPARCQLQRERLTVTPADNDAVPPVAAVMEAMKRYACVCLQPLKDFQLRANCRL